MAHQRVISDITKQRSAENLLPFFAIEIYRLFRQNICFNFIYLAVDTQKKINLTKQRRGKRLLFIV